MPSAPVTASSVRITSYTIQGFENLVQYAPHPNPPPLVYPPTCVQPAIGGQEPTSVDVLAATGFSNLLQPGLLPFGNPAACTPPDGLYSPTAHVLLNWGGPSAELRPKPHRTTTGRAIQINVLPPIPNACSPPTRTTGPAR